MTPMSGVLLYQNSGQSTAQRLISSMGISFWKVITKTNHRSYKILWRSLVKTSKVHECDYFGGQINIIIFAQGWTWVKLCISRSTTFAWLALKCIARHNLHKKTVTNLRDSPVRGGSERQTVSLSERGEVRLPLTGRPPRD